MNEEDTKIKILENGRAKFAYECANQILTLKESTFNNKLIETDKIIKDLFLKKFKKDDEKQKLEDFFKEPLVKYELYKNGNDLEKRIADFYEKKKKEYKSYVKKIPMLIKTNGLGATFAFMMSKGGIYSAIGKQILEWLKSDDKGIVDDIKKVNDFSQLNNVVVSLNSSEYRALTNEVLAFLNWLRRFAEGLIEGDENE